MLLTGFEPFQGRPVNGSRTLVEALAGKVIREHRVETEIFPVHWEGLEERLAHAIARADPILIIGMGEGSREYPCFETFARNEAEGKDSRGHSPPEDLIDRHDLPVRRSSMEFDHTWFQGLPLRIVQSESAGTYLCNALFYKSLALSSAKVGFIHLPVQGTQSDADYISPLIPILYRLISKNINAILDGAQG